MSRLHDFVSLDGLPRARSSWYIVIIIIIYSTYENISAPEPDTADEVGSDAAVEVVKGLKAPNDCQYNRNINSKAGARVNVPCFTRVELAVFFLIHLYSYIMREALFPTNKLK